MEGDFVSYQASWSRAAGNGHTHCLDLHWRINNSQLLAKTLSYEELASRSIALPALGPTARTLDKVDALLFACIHRAGHAHAPYYSGAEAHYGERIIWLYDIALLLAQMSAQEVDAFAQRATEKRIVTICRDALHAAKAYLAVPIPASLALHLADRGAPEASAHYFSGNRARQMLGDFLALKHWSERGRWAWETAFPTADYMHYKYPEQARTWLPLLHLRRLAEGLAGVIIPKRRRAP